MQVARLIVDRRTNPEIAAELFLSLKTVESHVRNLFHKLDVSSRVEVARAVERADRAALASGCLIRVPPRCRGAQVPGSSPSPQSQQEWLMATHLYRLGGWAFQHRRRVVALWATVLVAVVAAAAAFGGKTNDKFSVPGTESQQAQELLEQKYPAASGTYARLVFAAPEGERLTDAENKAAVEAALAKASPAHRTSRRSTSPYETKAMTEDGRDRLRRRRLPGPGRQDRRRRHATSSRRRPRPPRRPACGPSSAAASSPTSRTPTPSRMGMMVGFARAGDHARLAAGRRACRCSRRSSASASASSACRR